MSTIITRFPPSPTGDAHVGTVKTALLNYLFTKKSGGKIILRWEDTDKARSKKEFEQDIFEQLEWLGLSFDAVYHQSERTLIYQKYIEKMIADGFAYISEESTKLTTQAGEGEDEEDTSTLPTELRRIIRFKNPNKVITFTDVLRGEISVDTTELGDFVIARTIEDPLYHLAVVVDDFEMGVTHILRGEDGIYNTPRQILIEEAIGAPRPLYCHFPFFLSIDRSKLGKRNGSRPVHEYRTRGILPQAFINYLALLGWNPGTEQEIFTLQELINTFDLTRIQKAGAIFDDEKLLWYNREHMKLLSPQVLLKHILDSIPEHLKTKPQWSEERLGRASNDIRERINEFSDITRLGEAGDLDYYFETPTYEVSSLFPKEKPTKDGEKLTNEKILEHFAFIEKTLNELPESEWTIEGIKASLWEYATKEGRARVLWPLRYALSGKEKSPDPFTLSFILERPETLIRLNRAKELLALLQDSNHKRA